MSKQVLDPCCGSRMFWFQKNNPNVIYADCRAEKTILCDGRVLEINPDQIIDFRNIPHPDCTFNLVVFDPPHLNQLGGKSWVAKKYGVLFPTWKHDIALGFSECWRVLKYGGTLIFKWSEVQIKLSEIKPLYPDVPMFGHTTTKRLTTHWIVFYKKEISN